MYKDHNRFEAVFYEGEPDERLPSWDVVEWTNQSTNGKSGKVVKSFYGYNHQSEAEELAAKMNGELV